MRKRGLREAKPLAPNHSTKTVHQKGTTRGDKIPHVQSKGSVYERPRATILHIHVVCSIGGNAIPFQKWGVLALRISIRSQVGGGFLDTEGPPSTPPSHSADGLASLSCPQRGREERSWNGAVTSWSHCRGLGCCQSGLCRTHRLGLSGGRALGYNGQATQVASLGPLQS